MDTNFKWIQDNRQRMKTILWLTAGAAAFALYVYMIYRRVWMTDMDADYSSLVNEAHDFVHGNFFLSGWNQTGVSFLLTDFLYFAAGTAVFGLSKSAYVFAMTLMIVSLFAAGLLLVNAKSRLNTALYFALAAFPSVFVVSQQRAHIGGYIWTFIALAILMRSLKKGRISWGGAAGVVLLFAMCAMSDMAAVLFGAGTVLIVTVYKLLFDVRIRRKLYLKIAAVSAGGVALGMLADKLYYRIGGCNKNSFLDEKAFEVSGNLVDKFVTYIESALFLGNSEITAGLRIFSLKGLLGCLYAVFVLVGIVLVVKNVILILRNKDHDFVCTVLSLGYLLVAAAFIFTNIGIDLFSSRYFSAQPVLFAILICREVTVGGLLDKFFYTSRIRWKYVLCALTVVLAAAGVMLYRKEVQGEYVIPQENLARYLESQGLRNGYCNYWDGPAAAVTTGGAVTLRAVVLDGDGRADPFWWFSKDEWYTQYADYVVIDEAEAQEYGVTEENTVKTFGVPKKTYTYETYVIYQYDYDLSSKLQINLNE